MRKVNYFILLLMALLFSGPTADAVVVYWQGEQVATTPEIGKNYVLLASGGRGSTYYLSGTSKGLTKVGEDAVYQFVDAGMVNGAQTYYLKQLSTGKYVSNYIADDGTIDTGSGSELYSTTNMAEAFQFKMDKGVNGPTDSTSIYFYKLTSDYWKDNLDYTTDAYVLANVSGTGKQHLCGCNWGFFLAEYTDTNLFQIFTADELTGLNKLRTYYLSVTDPATTFTRGTSAGQVPPAIYDEAVAAYTHANDLMNGATLTNEQVDSAVNRLDSALKAAKTGLIPMKAGYYYIQNADNNNYVYNTNSTLKHKAATMPITDTKFVFEFTVASDSTFYMQNLGTGDYVGAIPAHNVSPIPTSAAKTMDQHIWLENGTWAITDRNSGADGFNRFSNGNVGSWTVVGDAGSHWNIVPVPDSIIENVKTQAAQDQLNNALTTLYTKAAASYQSSRKYVGITRDNVYTDSGLISDVSKIWSNAPYNNPAIDSNTDGGGYDALVNHTIDQGNDYFHSDWRTTATTQPHNLQMELSKSVSSVIFKMSRRMTDATGVVSTWKTNWLSYPTKLTIYATNDTAQWNQISTISLTYFNDTTCITEPIKLGADYKYVRADVVGTQFMVNNPTKIFFYVSEFAAYEPVLDEAASPYAGVSEATRTAFEAALTQAQTELGAAKATQATITALKSAYDAFLSEYADPQVARDLVTAANKLVTGAAVGTTPGYTTQEAIDALKAVVDAESAKVQDVMSMTTLNEIKTHLAAATATFLKTIVPPAVGKHYYIISKTTEAAGGNAVYAQNNVSGAQLKWGGANAAKELRVDSINSYPNFLWVVEQADNDSVYLRNIGTGFYMNENKTAPTMAKVYLKYAAAGVFNIVVNKTDSKYINIQPASHNVVTWNSATGSDNSAIAFQPVTLNVDEATFFQPITKGVTQIVTLPYKVVGADNGKLYKAIGQKEGKLILTETPEFAAGEPIVFVPKDTTTTMGHFYPQATDGLFTTVSQGQTVNGVVGVLGSTNIRAGLGVLKDTIVSLTKGLRTLVSANSGYILPELPVVTETGDLQIPIAEAITAITNVEVAPSSNIYYDLQGRRVAKPVRGLYIVGGKKIFIK